MGFTFKNFTNPLLYKGDLHHNKNYSNFVNLSNNLFVHPLLQKLFKEFVNSFQLRTLNQYPYYDTIETEIASFYGIDNKNLILTAGSVDAIKNIFFSVVSNANSIIIEDPNFVEYYNLARLYKKNIYKANHFFNNDEFLEDIVDKMKKHKKAVIIITNPNGITGSCINYAELKFLLNYAENHGHIMIVDAAYVPYNGFEYTNLVHEFKNLIIIKSFSKSFGLAGLRTAMIISSVEIIEYLQKLNLTGNLSVIALNFLKYCHEKHSLYEAAINELIESRENINKCIKNYYTNGEIFYSKANFSIIRFLDVNSAIDIYEYFKEHGILIKKLGDHDRNFSKFIRITSSDKMTNQLVQNLLINYKAKCCQQ